MLNPTPFAATAGRSSAGGTSRGTTACQGGAVSASPALTKKARTRSRDAVTRSSQTSPAIRADVTAMNPSPQSRKRRLSRLSVSAPAGIANRKIGRVVATCTSETTSGDESRLVISQPAAAAYIHPPMFEIRVAVQMTANTRCPKGDHGDAAVGDMS